MLHAEDPRFEREAELLRRIHHPSVPRLLDSGHWQAPSGGVYPQRLRPLLAAGALMLILFLCAP